MPHSSRISILLGGVLIAALGCHRSTSALTHAAQPPPPAHTSVQLPRRATIADAAARITPSVVNVFPERKVQRPQSSPFFRIPVVRSLA